MADTTMKAIRVSQYGGPEVLKLEQVARPKPQTGEILVHVHAAGVNPIEWKIRAGYMKDFIPTQFPYIPGADIAGVVEEIGAGVAGFQVGQAVYGQGKGAYAEYSIASAESLSVKPDKLSFEEAASLPVGSLTAWQGIFDHGKLTSGQKVLIHGAAGGVGLFAVQFAHWKGAQVYATTSTENVEFVQSLGADTVIDYKKTAFETVAKDIDLVLDAIGGEVQNKSWQVLKKGGILIAISAPPSPEKAQEHHVRAEMFSMNYNTDQQKQVTDLIEEGKVKTVIYKTFPLAEAEKAHELSQTGHGRGRIVLQVG